MPRDAGQEDANELEIQCETEYFAAPGPSIGAGTRSDPWSLASALAESSLSGGDCLSLLGGTYEGQFFSTLAGTTGKPIIVRPESGAEVRILGSLTIDGQETWFMDLEVANESTTASGPGVLVRGNDIRLSGLVVHNHATAGILLEAQAERAQVHGSIVYNNGWSGEFSGIAAFNDETGPKELRHNVVFNQFGEGISSYSGEGNGKPAKQLSFVENIAFNNGMVGVARDFLLGGTPPTGELVFHGNATYRSPGQRFLTSSIGFRFGADNEAASIRDNLIYGRLEVAYWQAVTFEANTLIGTLDLILNQDQLLTEYTWDDNEYLSVDPQTAFKVYRYAQDGHGTTEIEQQTHSIDSWRGETGFDASSTIRTPQGSWVRSYPSQFHSGRGFVVIYNLDGAPSANLDISDILNLGDSFELIEVQDLSAPVLSGVYDGSPVTVPLAAVEGPVAITGESGGPPPTPPSTGLGFHVFLVRAN